MTPARDTDGGGRASANVSADVLYVHEDRTVENWGIELVRDSIRRLAAAGPWPSVPRVVEGPHFVYEEGPDLFLGRTGRGPLRLAWDTNLLIDYFDHGEALWSGEALSGANERLNEDLEALQLVMGLWVLRDIHIVLVPGVASDARRQLTERRRRDRVRAFFEFARAISLVTGEDTPPPRPPLHLPPSILDAALDRVPGGGDRMLVRQAVETGVHVFLTRDRRVLACAAAFRPLGLAIVGPQDLLELLAACGAFCCMTEPRQLYWPFPDLQRVTHLARAVPGLELPGPQFSTLKVGEPMPDLDPVMASVLQRISRPPHGSSGR